jgi:hypothetical protein
MATETGTEILLEEIQGGVKITCKGTGAHAAIAPGGE